MIERDLLRELDAVLRAVAPVEHPVGASPLVVTFDELELDRDFVPGMLGLSLTGLDTFAAWLRDDESLVGRPVVAVAVDRVISSATSGTTFFRDVALESLRDVTLHEIAHGIGRRSDQALDPASFPKYVRERFSTEPGLRSGPTSHPLEWWLRYVVLVARLATVAPRIYPEDFFRSAAEKYGFGTAEDAADWISAAQSDPDLLSGSVLEAAARRTPELERILDTFRPQAAEPVSAAALQRA